MQKMGSEDQERKEQCISKSFRNFYAGARDSHQSGHKTV